MQAQKKSLFPTESPGERKYASSYISMKHAPYVTPVHCWDTTHAIYVIGTSARNSQYIL